MNLQQTYKLAVRLASSYKLTIFCKKLANFYEIIIFCDKLASSYKLTIRPQPGYARILCFMADPITFDQKLVC